MRKITLNGNTYEITYIRQVPASHFYEVKLVSGKWDTNDDLITMCDNSSGVSEWGEPNMNPCHFGGRVKNVNLNLNEVVVYFD